jgi:hypothetical protein
MRAAAEREIVAGEAIQPVRRKETEMTTITKVAALAALAVGLGVPAVAQAGAGGSDVPYKATLTGYGYLNSQTGEVHAVGTGEATHLGRWTLDEHGLAVPTTPGNFAYSSTYTITAANGDQLFGVITGTGSTTDGIHFTFVLDGHSTSGTGRFADASLTQHAVIRQTVDSVEGAIFSGPAEGTVVGTFSH